MEASAGIVGAGLILVGITLLVIEAHVAGWGGPGALGVVSLVAGVLIVLDAGDWVELPRGLIIALCVVAALFVPLATFKVIKAHKAPAYVPPTLLGAEGVAVSELNPSGVVLVRSEQHSASTDAPPISAGERVRVVAEEGIKLRVVKS